MMDKLKPCPHCGKDHIIIDTCKRDDRPKCKWTCHVVCVNCFASTSNHGFDWTKEEAEEKAVAAWNRRTSDD